MIRRNFLRTIKGWAAASMIAVELASNIEEINIDISARRQSYVYRPFDERKVWMQDLGNVYCVSVADYCNNKEAIDELGIAEVVKGFHNMSSLRVLHL